jgi:hypothetical protein
MERSVMDDDRPLFRMIGERAAKLCAMKARDVAMFDSAAAKAVILGELRQAGQPVSGEDLVDKCLQSGIETHDGRAFGAVFSSLRSQGLIRCAGYTMRRKGHGTAGGRLWELAK